MSDQKSLAIAPSEAKTLFADLHDVPVIALAVSGGPDSTALMLLAARWRVEEMDIFMATDPGLLDPRRAVPSPALA